MLYAFVSDIHANLTAWKAVLADLTAMKAEKIICLGDVVGYGPEPAEVLESLYRHVDAFVMGNHDAVVAGKMSAGSFNDHAKEMIEWSMKRVSQRGRLFLAKQPLILCGPDFVCTHGSLDRPQAFNYILTPEEALASFNATISKLSFVGHTHIPSVAVLGSSGTPYLLKSQDFEFEESKRYIVNTGSVGDPRDEDPRASYCLYDDVKKVITFRKVAFDYETLKIAVTKAGMDPQTVSLLKRDPIPTREPVRETLGFAPPSARESMAKNVEESQDLSSLRKTTKHLRYLVASLIIAACALGGALSGLAVRHAKEASLFIPEKPLKGVETLFPPDIWNNQLPSIPAGDSVLEPRGMINGWRYSLANPEKQHISLLCDPDTQKPLLAIRNEERLGFRLEAPEWNHNGYANNYRLSCSVQAKKSGDFRGKATMNIFANWRTPEEKLLVSGDLNLKEPEIMKPTKRTMKKNEARLGNDTRRITFSIDGEFSGTLTISDPTLITTE